MTLGEAPYELTSWLSHGMFNLDILRLAKLALNHRLIESREFVGSHHRVVGPVAPEDVVLKDGDTERVEETGHYCPPEHNQQAEVRDGS